MKPILERLLEWGETPFEGDPIVDALLSDVELAAAEITRLEAENSRLVASMRMIGAQLEKAAPRWTK